MAHNPRIPFGFRPADVYDAFRLSEPVTVYCLNCAKDRHVGAERLSKLKGNLKFGMLQGGFWCRECKRSAIVVLFPSDVATPRDWVRHMQNQKRDGANDTQMPHALPYRIDRWNDAGDIEKVLLMAADFNIAQGAFSIVRAQYPEKVKLTLREGAEILPILSPPAP